MAQAAGKVLGKAKTTLQYTVPHDQAFIGSELARLQQSVLPQILGSLPTNFFRAATHHHHPSPPNLDIKRVLKCEAEIEPRWASW